VFASQICVIAGPRSIGKSRFIERCRVFPLGNELPPALRDHFASQPPVVHLMNLGNHRHANHQRATVHLDIFTPFQDLRPLSAHELGSEMQVARFAAYPHLDCLADANRLLIVTLRAPRQIVLNRWLDRVAREHREMVRTNLARIYSDASDDRLFNRLYEAWYGFLDSMPVAERWRADVAGDTATLISEP
jgi:hypothetical protein